MAKNDQQFSREVKKPDFRVKAASFHERMTSVPLNDCGSRQELVTVRLYRFAILLYDEIMRTELPRRAAALTYTTILSLFPLLAVAFAFVGLLYTEEKQDQVLDYLQQQFLPASQVDTDMLLFLGDDALEEVEKQKGIGEFFEEVSTSFRENASGVGVFGFIGLLVAGGILFFSIETTVNQIWRASTDIQWSRTLTNFVTTLVLMPIVLGLAITTTTLAALLFDPEGANNGQASAQAQEPANPAEVAEAVVETAAPTADSADESVPFFMIPPPPETAQPEDGSRLARLQEIDVKDIPAQAIGPRAEGSVAAGALAPAAEPREPSALLRRVQSVTRNFGFVITLVPILANTLILTLAYVFLPRAKVRFAYALVGAFLAAALWECAKYLFVLYIGLSTINRTLLNAFGAPVIFLIWVYVTWLILLLGVLISYITQNFTALWSELKVGNEVMMDSRLYLAVMILLARRFLANRGGYSEHDLRVRLGVNQTELRQILKRLEREKLVVVLKNGDYLMARPPEMVPAEEVLRLGCDLGALPVVERGHTGVGNLFRDLEQRSVSLCGGDSLEDLVRAAQGLISSPSDDESTMPIPRPAAAVAKT